MPVTIAIRPSKVRQVATDIHYVETPVGPFALVFEPAIDRRNSYVWLVKSFFSSIEYVTELPTELKQSPDAVNVVATKLMESVLEVFLKPIESGVDLQQYSLIPFQEIKVDALREVTSWKHFTTSWLINHVEIINYVFLKIITKAGSRWMLSGGCPMFVKLSRVIATEAIAQNFALLCKLAPFVEFRFSVVKDEEVSRCIDRISILLRSPEVQNGEISDSEIMQELLVIHQSFASTYVEKAIMSFFSQNQEKVQNESETI